MISFRKLAWFFIPAILLSLAAFSFVSFSYAQESSPIQILGVNTNFHPQIEITVAVFDKSGRPLNGLNASNFSVFEDNTALPVTSLNSITDQSIPLGIVLVMDTSQSMDEAPLGKAKAAALAFVDQVRPIDELALVSFNSKITVLQPMTKDRDAIKARINGLTTTGQTALYDAIAQAVQTAQTSTAKRRVIVLLTDGNEYGHLSKTSGVDAYTAASKAGIPVFTIGLGFEIDASYLKTVSDKTGGAFYEAPRPEDLGTVYSNIATVLRSLYVLTVSTSLPANGDTHTFRVEFHSDSDSGTTQSNARFPAPIPVVRFSGVDPNVPLDKVTTVRPQIVADNTLTSYEYQLDGKAVVSGNGIPTPLQIDPMKLVPGAHSLTLAVHDDKNHVGTGTLDFKVAALPPVFSIQGLKAGDTISDNRGVLLNVTESQTPTGTATFDIDGTVLRSIDQAPYALSLDVLSLTPGKHVLTAQLKNADATGTQSVEFNVSPGPRLTATASVVYQGQTATAIALHQAQTATASVVYQGQTATANAIQQATATAIALHQAQTATASAIQQAQTATANAIQQATATANALAQAQTATASVVYRGQTATANALAQAQTATANSIQQATATANALAQAQTATANSIRQATATANALAQAQTATANSIRQATATANALAQAQTATANSIRQATATANALAQAQTATASVVYRGQTATANALAQAQTATASAIQQATATANALAQATRNVQATLTAQPTKTSTPTSTPRSTTTNLPTNTPLPPTVTSTSTPIPPTLTQSVTFTPVPFTATNNQTATVRAAALAVSQVPSATAASSLTATVTASPTATATHTPIPPTPTNTAIPPSATNTNAPTNTRTPIPPTVTNTSIPTNTRTPIPPTVTNTSIPTNTRTPIPPTLTNTAIPPTATATNTPLPTATMTATATATATTSATATATATVTITLTLTPSSTLSLTPSLTQTPTVTPTPTAPLGGLGTLTSNPAVLLCGGLLVIVVIVLMILSGARRSPRRLS